MSTAEPSSDDDSDARETVVRPASVGSSGAAVTLSDEGIGAVVGVLATLAVLLFVVAGLLAWRRQRQFGGGVHRVLKCLDGPAQNASATTAGPPTSPRRSTVSQFNGTANGTVVAAKVLRFFLEYYI